MATRGPRRIYHNVYIVSLLDPDEESPGLVAHSLTETCYLYISVPFQAESEHKIIVCICIVPFSIPEHRGQIFHYAEMHYSECCNDLMKGNFFASLTHAVNKVYNFHVRHHFWDFRDTASWRQIQIPETINWTGWGCAEKATALLEHLLSYSKTDLGIEQHPSRKKSKINPILHGEQAPYSIKSTKRPSQTSLVERLGNHFTPGVGRYDAHDRRDRKAKEDIPTTIADEFLLGFQTTRLSRIVVKLHDPLWNKATLENTNVEPATQAFNCCASIIKQAKEQMKHATFTRFVSLCFFLIWEAFACKPGKAGARVINEKMKEAGFEGTSRSLKTLRDETVFINQLVASVEIKYGIGVASLVFYHIFDSSNYHLVRLINRYGMAKKRLVVEHIRDRLDVTGLSNVSLPVIQISEVIREYMPNLDKSKISGAIGYYTATLTTSIRKDLDCI